MFIALYGQFVINACILAYMLLQIYNNYRTSVQISREHRYLDRAITALAAHQQESDEDLKQYKKTLAALMVTLSRELDAMEAKINKRRD